MSMVAESAQPTVVDYWPVGQSQSTTLPMGTTDISRHLAADWVPSLPATVSNSFIGWPPELIRSLDPTPVDPSPVLCLKPEAGRCERQWKGFLAWMLGVAGTRHVLEDEGFAWIAPLSAFYPETTQDVDLANWHVGEFPRCSVEARRRQGNASRLRPDYVALRSVGSSESGTAYEWAIVESKGTRKSVTNLTQCPVDWHRQVRNVQLEVHESPQEVARHLVVATRVNPNAVRDTTRRISIRAWNSASAEIPQAPLDAVADIAAAHVFGLCHKFQLTNSAHALALAVDRWGNTRAGSQKKEPRREEEEIWGRAEDELRRAELPPVQLEEELIQMDLAPAIITLVKELWAARTTSEAAEALGRAEKLLSRERAEQVDPQVGQQPSRSGVGRDRVAFSSGVVVSIERR